MKCEPDKCFLVFETWCVNKELTQRVVGVLFYPVHLSCQAFPLTVQVYSGNQELVDTKGIQWQGVCVEVCTQLFREQKV